MIWLLMCINTALLWWSLLSTMSVRAAAEFPSQTQISAQTALGFMQARCNFVSTINVVHVCLLVDTGLKSF